MMPNGVNIQGERKKNYNVLRSRDVHTRDLFENVMYKITNAITFNTNSINLPFLYKIYFGRQVTTI